MRDYNKLEQERVEALYSRDAVKYFQKCNESGVEPTEAPELYELGKMEAESKFGKLEKSVKKLSKRKRTVPNSQYKIFYDESIKFDLNIGRDSDEKRELLIKYFPGRFGDEGRNPILKMEFLSVGNLFKKMVEYSERRINQ